MYYFFPFGKRSPFVIKPIDGWVGMGDNRSKRLFFGGIRLIAPNVNCGRAQRLHLEMIKNRSFVFQRKREHQMNRKNHYFRGNKFPYRKGG